MRITPGDQLAHYTLSEQIGEGGMGVVWRARDTKLDRDVAIKILPAEFAEYSGRLARFQREAKLLASLSHNHIASIYGFEEAGDVRALVMELVGGPTLAERLERGAMVAEEALTVARQIAEALEFAHEQEVVHRDLKPANVKLRPDGNVKVLDFGLAKALSEETPADSSPGLTQSPTMTMGGTVAGTILGTAAYMAPEQAAGTAVDRRADIWAFGVVLWEMFTGKTLFQGETVTHVLASVMKDEPDLDQLPTTTPSAIRGLIARCLRRKPRQRLQSIGDARVLIEDVLDGREVEPSPVASTARATGSGSRGYAFLALFALSIIVINAAAWYLRPEPEVSRPVTRFTVELAEDAPAIVSAYPGHAVAISRDGSTIAYHSGGDGPQLQVRRLDDLEIRPIAGTEQGASQPFFSPDGSWVGCFTSNSLQKVPLKGGQPVTLARDLAGGAWLRGSWSDDDRIVYDTWNGGLRVVSTDGGPSEILTRPTDEWHLGPQMLPDSNTFLFFVQTATSFRIESMSLDGEARRTVLEDASHPVYLASGHLQFVREGGLMVAAFDVDALQVTGSPVPLDLPVLVDHVNVGAPIPQLAVSLDGTLVYAPRTKNSLRESTLVWVDREGNVEELAKVPFPRPHFSLSRDGTRVALTGRNGAEVYYEIMDVARKMLTPFRTETIDYPAAPMWSNDGSRIYFPRFGTHQSQLFSQAVDGGEPESLLTIEGTWLAPMAATPDERYVVFFVYDPVTEGDLWYLDREAGNGEDALRPFLVEPGTHQSASLSPDGRWLAYAGYETGESEVYLRRFPGGESRVRVSSDGGYGPLWSPDGRELYYRSQDGSNVRAVTVETGPTSQLGDPRFLFTGSFQSDADVGYSWAIHPNGERFLMVVEDEKPRQASRLVVVENWFAEIEELVGR